MDIVITPEIAILSLLILLSAFISLYFFFGRKLSTYSDKILGVHFMFLSLGLVFYLLGFIEAISNHTLRIVNFLQDPIGFNLIFFYIRSVISTNYKLSKEHFLHLTPFVICYVILIIYIFFPEKINSWYGKYSIIQRTALIVTYAILSMLALRSYESSRNNNFSNKEIRKVDWLKFLLYSTLIYCLFPITWGILSAFTSFDPDFQIGRIIAGASFVIYLLIVLWQVSTHGHETQAIDIEKFPVKYRSSGLDTSQKSSIKDELIAKMNEVEPYLDSDVTLTQISQLMDLPARQLSQVINEELKQNFYEFINHFRIEYAKNLLTSKSKEELTVKQIMYSSGFNSKSSFHTAFKKSTGKTPSAYRKI